MCAAFTVATAVCRAEVGTWFRWGDDPYAVGTGEKQREGLGPMGDALSNNADGDVAAYTGRKLRLLQVIEVVEL